MRILHAYKIYRPDIEGGVPAVMACLAQDPESTFDHGIVCARRRGLARHGIIDGVDVDAVSSLGTLFSTPLAPAFIPRFIAHARAADIVIHHAPLPLNDAAILLGLPTRTALIVYWHAEIVGYAMLKKAVSPMIRRVLARADRIVVSGAPMIAHSPFLRPHAEKCVVMPFGMNLDPWRLIDATDLAHIDALRRAKPRHIVALGRLVGYKGYDVLIRAMARIDGHTTIIGEGPLLPKLQKLARETGVADRVSFAGRLTQREIVRTFHAANIFAFPSVTVAEAFGLVQIEAMATGLPVVNTSLASTVPFVARDGLEALTVTPGDVAALATSLTTLLDDPDLARRLGDAGRARAFSEFDQSVYRSRMADVYADALQSRRRILAQPI